MEVMVCKNSDASKACNDFIHAITKSSKRMILEYEFAELKKVL